jgi:hypothetical protein
MPFSVVVLCVLCAFVVKNPFLVALLYRSRALPAHYTPALCSNVIHPSRHVGHQNRHSSPLPTPSISVGSLQTCIHNNFNVIKCNHLYRQLPSPTLLQPTRIPFKGSGMRRGFASTPARSLFRV